MRRAMRPRRAARDEKRRHVIGRKNTNRPTQTSTSPHGDATRPASYARATRNTPMALVRLSTGSHPHASDVDLVTTALLLDTSGDSGTASLIGFIPTTPLNAGAS